MLKAILQNGVIVPLEPLPPEWAEGTALEIAPTTSEADDLDRWAIRMKELCLDSDAENESIMRAAIEEHRRLGKSQMRHEMGLPQ